jgi:hypothetical protein
MIFNFYHFPYFGIDCQDRKTNIKSKIIASKYLHN